MNIGSGELLVLKFGSSVQDSNFAKNSFRLENSGDKVIVEAVIDVTGALYPDSVFDPFGVGGDAISKELTIDTDGGTGAVAPTMASYIGAGGAAGYSGIRLTFDEAVSGGFQPGEEVRFSVDMDPNSIAGTTKNTLDAGSSPDWDIGGISGAELIGSTLTLTFADGTTATGQLHGADNQFGSKALAAQDTPNLSVNLTVNGLTPGGTGSYDVTGPAVTVSGPAGETARVVLTKGFIQPVVNLFDEPVASQLNAQLAVLAAGDFPANNAVEFQTVDVVLDGTVQDISSLFDFSGVPIYDFAGEDELPLGFVASVIDTNNDDFAIGPVTTPIYLKYEEATSNQAPSITSSDAFTLEENGTAVGTVTATDPENDTLSYAIAGGADSAQFAINASTGALSFLSAPDFETPTDLGADNVYDLQVSATDGSNTTTQDIAVTVSDVDETGGHGPTNGNDNLEGTIGDDTVALLDGDDIYRALGGSDSVSGDGGNDTVRGGSDDDTVSGGADDDQITGGNGSDSIGGDAGNDLLFGNGDGDMISGGDGADTIYGGAGDDTASGGTGDDEILGQGGADVLAGDAGADTLFGGSGNDTLSGGDDDDTLYGNGNNDSLMGDAGNDRLQGAGGLDTLIGGAGDDTMTGGSGNDSLDGGAGNDVMNGGAGADRFVFAAGYDQDRINGFEQGLDTIELDDGLWTGTLTGQDVVDTFGSLNATGTILTLDFGGGDILEIQNGSGINIATLGADIDVNETPPNQAPSITSAATYSIAENGTSVGTVVATDPESDPLTYAISGGADASRFLIEANTGALSFASAPDFEAPADVGTDNVYDLQVSVTDATNTVAQDIAVTITDVDETPFLIDVFLVDADNDQVIAEITDGGTIDLDGLSSDNLSIFATIPTASPFFGTVGSVSLDFENGQVLRTESGAPYALFGDLNGDYAGGFDAEDRLYQIHFDIFSDVDGGGSLLGSESFDFNLVNSDTGIGGPIDPPPSASGYYLSEDGRVKFQFEDLLGTNPQNGWVFQDDTNGDNPGYQGSGYYYWKTEEGQALNGATEGNISAMVFLEEAGTYNLRVRSARDFNDPNDGRNDMWINIDDNIISYFTDNIDNPVKNNGYAKLFGAGSNWGFAFRTEDKGPGSHVPPANVELAAGFHEIQFAGRSQGFHIDYFEMYLVSGTTPSAGSDDSQFIDTSMMNDTTLDVV